MALDPGEMLVVDGGFCDRGHCCAETPAGLSNEIGSMKATARARHEVINSAIKNFTILKQKCQHLRHKHATYI